MKINLITIQSGLKKRFITLVMCIGFAIPFFGIAQSPVQVTAQMIPPYSVTLADYATANSDRLVVNLLLGDVTEFNRQVTLKLSVEGDGIAVQSADVVAGVSPITLDGGVPLRLTNIDLRPYFQIENLVGISPVQYSRPLPGGLYRFCFEAYDYLTGRLISTKSCAIAYIVLNDPPILNLPVRNENIVIKNPQNIIFNWTPRHVNATNIQYEFTLAEIWDTNIDPQAGFLASRPLYQTTTRSTTLLYGPAQTPLLPDKTYGWRVRAIAVDGINELSLFKNGGYSEVYHFNYTGQCSSPQYILAESNTYNAAQVFWQGVDHQKYQVQYRKKDGNNSGWFEVNAYNENAKIQRLEENTTYEYRVGGQCGENGGYTYSRLFEFTTTTRGESNFTCGVTPELHIDNQDPLETLVVNDVFTAGEFPITVKRILSGNTESPDIGEVAQGGNGIFSGWGYITVPYLADTRIKIGFVNIKINTDYELVDGILVTDYDPDWNGMDDISDEIEVVTDAIDTVGDVAGDVIDTIGDAIDNTGSGNDNPPVDPNTPPTDPDTPDDPPTDENPPTDEETEDPPPGDEDPPADPETDNPENDGEGENTTKEIFIRYKGKDYKNGEVIEIQYQRDLPDQKFEIIGVEGKEITWDVYENFDDISVIKAFTDTDNDIAFNVLAMPNKYVLAAEYKEKKDIRVNILIIKDEFNLSELTATHRNRRVAKSDEILYLIDPPSATDTRKEVRYDIKINPELNSKKYSKSDIVWYYGKNGTQLNTTKNEGEKTITRYLTESSDVLTTTVKAGYPNTLEKNVNVKWVKEDYNKNAHKFLAGFDLMPHLKELAKKLGVPVYHEEGKYATDTKFSILADPEYLTESKNIEDEKSRLTYFETKQKYRLRVGVKGKFEKGIPYLSLPSVKKTYLGVDFEFALGVYFFMQADALGEIGNTKVTEDWIENKEKRNKTYLKVADPSKVFLRARIGLDPKLVIKASDNIKGKISGQSFAEAIVVQADFVKETFSFPIIEDGFALKFKPTINFKFYEWEYNYSIDEKVYHVRW